MAIHLVAYYGSTSTSNADNTLTPVADPTVTINVDQIYVPAKYNKIVRAYGYSAQLHPGMNQHLEAPSLREMFYPYFGLDGFTPTALAAVGTLHLDDSPIQLQTNEGLTFKQYLPATVTGAADAYGVVMFSDGPITPTKGKIYRMRCGHGITEVAGQWVSGQISFLQSLPVGTYDIVGIEFGDVDAVAMRLIFIGDSAITRPGVVNRFAYYDFDAYKQQDGAMGVLGTFDSVTPPSIELLGGSKTGGNFYLDLIKRG